jgi:tripartite-type tricarboxylate transporter receptor subunit TctC
MKKLLFLALMCFAMTVRAQAWPTQQVRLVAPFPTGGGLDLIARLTAEKLSARLGQTFFVDNRVGASGNIGSDFVAKAKPDGYTLLMHITMFSTYKYTFPNLPYDALKDFAAVGTVADSPGVIVVAMDSPLKSLQDLIAAANSTPGGISYGTAGIGSPQHIAMEQLAKLGKFPARHIAYKGSGPLMNDVVGNQINVGIVGFTSAQGLIDGKRVRALVSLGAKRTPMAPTVPTVAEAGIKGIESTVRYLLLFPAGTPQPIIHKLNTELNLALADPAVQQAFAKAGYDTVQSTPEEAAAMVKNEYEVWGPVIRSLNLAPQ